MSKEELYELVTCPKDGTGMLYQTEEDRHVCPKCGYGETPYETQKRYAVNETIAKAKRRLDFEMLTF